MEVVSCIVGVISVAAMLYLIYALSGGGEAK